MTSQFAYVIQHVQGKISTSLGKHVREINTAAHSAYDMFHGIKYLIVSLFFPTSVFGVGIFF